MTLQRLSNRLSATVLRFGQMSPCRAIVADGNLRFGSNRDLSRWLASISMLAVLAIGCVPACATSLRPPEFDSDIWRLCAYAWHGQDPSPIPCDDVAGLWRHCVAAGEACSDHTAATITSLAYRLSSPDTRRIAREAIDRMIAAAERADALDQLPDDSLYAVIAQIVALSSLSDAEDIPELASLRDEGLLDVALGRAETIDAAHWADEEQDAACWLLASPATLPAMDSSRFRSDALSHLLGTLDEDPGRWSWCGVALVRDHWHRFDAAGQEALLDRLVVALAFDARQRGAGEDASGDKLEELLAAMYWPGATQREEIAAYILQAAALQRGWSTATSRLLDVPVAIGLLAAPFPLVDDVGDGSITVSGGASAEDWVVDEIRSPAWPMIIPVLRGSEVDVAISAAESICEHNPEDRDAYVSMLDRLLDSPEVQNNPHLHLRILRACRIPANAESELPPASIAAVGNAIHRTASVGVWPASASLAAYAGAFDDLARHADPWLRLAAAWNLAAACGLRFPWSTRLAGPAAMLESERDPLMACDAVQALPALARDRFFPPRD